MASSVGKTSLPGPVPAAKSAGRSWLAPLAVAAVAILALLPFSNRAFHIDDTVFVRIAEQILVDPLHPYDFSYNWDYQPRSMWKSTQHPPLHSYVLAGIIRLSDGRERTLHLWYLGFAAGCAVLMHSLAKRLCAFPLSAALLGIATPAFLVSACSLMADVPLLFFWLLAVWAAIVYADTGHGRWLWLAGLSATAAALTKYFGIALVPLLTVYCVPRGNRAPGHLLALALPVVGLLAWGIYSEEQCGFFHPLGAVENSIAFKLAFLGPLLTFAQSVAYLGASLVWPVLLLPLAVRLPKWLSLAALLLALGALAIEYPAQTTERDGPGVDLGTIALFAVASLGGSLLLAIALQSWRERFDAQSTLLALWLFGTMAFVALCNWTVNARVILPCVPAAALLTVRWIERLETAPFWMIWSRAATAVTFALAFWVALADQEFGNAGRDFAETTVRKLVDEGHRVLFAGHWGFQRYMESVGAQAIDHSGQIIHAGDYVVYPQFNSYVMAVNVPTVFEEGLTRTYDNPYILHTMCTNTRAGFYTSGHACLPFNWSAGLPIDEFRVYRALDPRTAPPLNPQRLEAPLGEP